MDAVRVLPQVERVGFDIPTEIFTIDLRAGAEPDPVLGAIRDLGYAPDVLDGAPASDEAITHLRSPTSAALRKALDKARSRGVPLVIEFGGPFCPLCRKFEQVVLQDERVVSMLTDFEFLQIDVESDPDAAEDFDVHGVPDVWALDADGKVLARNNGYMTPEAFIGFLQGLQE